MRHALAWIVLWSCSVCAAAEPAPDRALLTQEHWVTGESARDKTPLKLYVREKRPADMQAAAFAGGNRVVLLLHGATIPASLGFDPPTSTPGRYSLIDALARRGFDVFALDFQNYGRSDKHACGLCVDTRAAAKDVDATVEYIRGLRGVDKVQIVGHSWGCTVAGLYATNQAGKVHRLVFFAPPLWTNPPGSKPPSAEFRKITRERVELDPKDFDSEVAEAWMKAGLALEQAPNGVLVDLNTRMPITDPTKITPPTMVIVGALDKIAPVTDPNLPGYFMALPNPDKQLIVIPGGTHSMHLQSQRSRLGAEIAKWFELR